MKLIGIVLLFGGVAGFAWSMLQLNADKQLAAGFFGLVACITGGTLLLDAYIMKGATRRSK